MFQAEFVITERCNFNCDYCYMINRDVMMSREVFDAHFESLPRILEDFDESRYTFVYFGGEPLMNWGLIEDTLSIVQNHSLCSGINLPTNGFLLDDYKIRILKAYQVNVSLSYDGLWQKNFHDLPHLRKIIREFGFRSCKAMITPDHLTKKSLVDNYESFLELGIPDPDFTLVRDKIWKAESVNLFEKNLVELTDKVIEKNKKGIETLPGIFSLYILDTLAGKKFGKRKFNCFAGIHGLAFMPDGEVYPCARFGSLKINDWPKFKNTEDYEICKKCELRQYCNAGCSYSQWINNGEPLVSICKLLKICYREAFRLVDELKDNETFRKKLNSLIKENNL